MVICYDQIRSQINDDKHFFVQLENQSLSDEDIVVLDTIYLQLRKLKLKIAH